ncbi:MAG: two-component system, OmpR family, sensor kinase [Frankiaceae bacterium]|nr:two-component system, OmpR family, sensor kinase [Frankiaceae bacterium]
MNRPAAYLARAPLRVRLVAAVLLLVTIALAGSAFLATTALRSYLVSRDDQQLSDVLAEVVQCAPVTTATTAPASGDHFCGRAGPRFTRPAAPGATPGTQTQTQTPAPGAQTQTPAPGAQTLTPGTTAPTPGAQTPTPGQRESGPPSPFFVQFSQADGTVSTQVLNPLRASSEHPVLPALTLEAATARARQPFTVTGSAGGTQWRVVAAPLTSGGGSVMVAQSLGPVDATVQRLAWLEAGVGLVVLIAVALVGRFLVRRSLRPLEDVEATAEAIAAGDLSRRVPHDEHPTTEVGRLSTSLNGMLHQIETAFAERAASEVAARDSEERMRRFVADASHELRTPLTSIHGFADLVGRGAVSDPPEVVRFMARIEGEADRMRGLVEDLLLLARLDEQRPLDLVPVPLVDVAADVVLDAEALEPDRSITLVVDDNEMPSVLADETRLRQVITNLVRNAIVHTPPQTSVTVRVATMVVDGRPWGALEVIDDGPGLSPEDAARVFSRFYRVDASRSRDQGGSGLGLSIVSALVQAHHGRVQLDTEVGQGATFRVLLPLAPSRLTVTG